ncbi:MAG: PepSY domain-containing protein [Bacillota bacterium]
MNRRILIYAMAGLMVLGGAAGMGLLTAHAAPAAAAAATAPQVGQTADQGSDAQGDQPTYTSSIQVANPQDKSNDATEAGKSAEAGGDGSATEAAEAASLQGMAKITPEQAKAAALAAVPGTVLGASLDNENGNVVYSVEVKAADGVHELKIDAGNGTVLAQDSQNEDGADNEKGAKGIENEKGSNAPDTDQVQFEDQSGDQSGD